MTRRAPSPAVRLAGNFAAFAVLACAVSASASDTVDRRCYRNDEFTVLVRPNQVGNTHTVRKSTSALKVDCMFEERASDTVIGDDEPYFYVALRGPYLILDYGTSPDRMVFIFDVRTGKPLLEASYGGVNVDPSDGGMSDDFRYDDSSLTFWRVTRVPPTAQNCPDIRKRGAGGLQVVILEKSVFHFATAKLENLKARRCAPSQGGPGPPYKINGVPQE